MVQVLIVEDDEAIVDLYTQMLALRGHEVVAAIPNGERALRYLEAAPQVPDLILLDQRIPGVTGLDLLAARPPRAAAVPVILATADEGARMAARDRGAAAVLVKPFSLDRLMEEVERALAGPDTRPAGGTGVHA